MFNLLKKLQPKRVAVMERPRLTSKIVEEIHETFFTEVDKLLAEAKVSRSLDTDKQALIDKCERLKKLGFTATKEVKEATMEIERLRLLRAENEAKQGLIEAINYFSFKYPNYKFITEQSVKKICEKYGLVYGKITRYKGTVPDKNLEHIENFKIAEEDELYYVETAFGSPFVGSRADVIAKVNTDNELTQYIGGADPLSSAMRRAQWAGLGSIGGSWGRPMYGRYDKMPLEICAPQKDFNLSKAEIKNYAITKVVPPDPIVLCPVWYKGAKHYLIVTAWGDEASDENVVNEKMN